MTGAAIRELGRYQSSGRIMKPRIVASLLSFSTIVLAACSGEISAPVVLLAPQRDESPAQTDSTVYHLQRTQSEYRAWVTTTYTNRTTRPVYYRRCTATSAVPMFGVARTGA